MINRRIATIFLSLIIALHVILVPASGFADSIPAVPESRMTYLVMDAKTGHIICSSGNENDKVYPASLTKVMTAMVALDHCTDLDKQFLISQAAIDGIGVDGQNTGRLKAGMYLDFGQLLNIMMIYSANETSCAIAENIGGTIDGFIDMMNAKADSLGLTGTHYVNPCGMHDNDHYTTILDLAKIARASLDYPIIGEIAAKSGVSIDYGDGNSPVYYNSTNRLINQAHYGNYYNTTYTRDGASFSYKVTGLKTGYTDPAGCCLITTSTSTEGREIITVVLRASSSLVAANYSHKLLNYVHKNACTYTLCTSGEYYGTVDIQGSSVDQIALVYEDNADISILASQFNSELVTAKYVIPETITAPISAGDHIGQVQFFYNDSDIPIASVSLIAGSDAPTAIPDATTDVPPSDTDDNNSHQVGASPTTPSITVENPEPKNNWGSILIISAVGMCFFVTIVLFINKNAAKIKEKL